MITQEQRIDVLDDMLNLYWLRPENALWYAWDVPIIRHLLGDHPQPSLDLACGDGTTSFIMMGGKFGPEFDAYRSVFLKAERPYEWQDVPQDDYYDYFEEKDFEDPPQVAKLPEHRYTYGLDWKEALLKKAERLRLYDHLVQHDLNQPMRIFENGQFQTIFSNSTYWVENIQGLFAELHRILAPGGRLVVTEPDARIQDDMLYAYQRDYGLEWIKDLDRGRVNSYRHVHDTDGWVQLYESVGFTVEEHFTYGADIVLKVNDIGLRPLFPTLMHIYDVLRDKAPEDFLEIKNRWIANCRHFLLPLTDETWMGQFEMIDHWHAFRLSK